MCIYSYANRLHRFALGPILKIEFPNYIALNSQYINSSFDSYVESKLLLVVVLLFGIGFIRFVVENLCLKMLIVVVIIPFIAFHHLSCIFHSRVCT